MQRYWCVKIAVAVAKKSEYEAWENYTCRPYIRLSYKMNYGKYDAGYNVSDGNVRTMPQAPGFPAKPPLQSPAKYDLFKDRVNKNEQHESFWICTRSCRLG